ncbi:hypothetical protein BH10BAC4_BH10BAC4_01920 [soil metagenome]
MKPVFLLVLLICGVKLFAQSITADDVELRVSIAKTAEEKIKILNDAAAFQVNGDLKKSLEYAEHAQKLAMDSKDDIGLATAILNIGKYYTRVGMYDKAMENYIRALEISEQKSDESLKGLIYKVIGNNYYFRQDFRMAKHYYNRALVINQKFRDEETTADLQNNIALIFIASKNLDSALIYLQEARGPYERLQKQGKLANTLLNIGVVKAERKLYDEAIEYYQKAAALDKTEGLILQEGVATNNIATALIKLGRHDEAKAYVMKALAIGEEKNFKSLLMNVYVNLASVSKNSDDFNSIVDRLLNMKDSLYSEQNTRQIEELRTKYESEQKERENQHLVQQSAASEERLVSIRTLLVFVALFALVATLLAVFSYKSMLQNRRAKHELTKLNAQVNKQNEEIVAQSAKLRHANEEIAMINQNLQGLVEEKTSRILKQNESLIQYTFHNSHRVRGPLTRIMGLINLVKIGAIQKDETGYLLDEIDKASKELDSVLKDINHTLSTALVKERTDDGV